MIYINGKKTTERDINGMLANKAGNYGIDPNEALDIFRAAVNGCEASQDFMAMTFSVEVIKPRPPEVASVKTIGAIN